ncbi:MAG: thymidine phosphorylase [Verrucomicrobiota bacterium]
MHVPTIIEKKRDGSELSDSEIREFIAGYTDGSIPDYQMSALAMAIYFKGMTAEETASLTHAMLESGDVMSYPDSAPRIIDKHSTGGIGDKVSLVLAPLLACDEVWVPMISGRGLGITGGTLDKLEAIPGFNVQLTDEQALSQLDQIGVAMMGQTADICPADKKLYALRDVTATVPSQPLIVASIMSKKLAETLDALVLDVKFGSGAFMKTRAEAESLGAAMQAVGQQMGVDTQSILNPMDQPLGHAVGNSLEVQECLELLQGKGPSDLRTLILDLASAVSIADRTQLEAWLDDGSAWEKFQSMCAAQNGNLSAFAERPPAAVIREISAPISGVIQAVDADTVGRASLALGAGRAAAGDDIDHAVGFDRIIKIGDSVTQGDCVGRLHANDAALADAAASQFLSAISIN